VAVQALIKLTAACTDRRPNKQLIQRQEITLENEPTNNSRQNTKSIQMISIFINRNSEPDSAPAMERHVGFFAALVIAVKSSQHRSKAASLWLDEPACV
jgi:hypothetical protein